MRARQNNLPVNRELKQQKPHTAHGAIPAGNIRKLFIHKPSQRGTLLLAAEPVPTYGRRYGCCGLVAASPLHFSVSSSAIANTLFGLCQLLLPAYFTRTEPLMESAVICAEPSPLTTCALSDPGSSRSASSPSSHANPPDTRSLVSVKPASSGTSSVIDPLVESSAVCSGKPPASVTSSAPETLVTERSVVTAPSNETDPLIEADRSSSCLPPPFVFTAQALTLLCSVHDVRDPAIERDGKEHQEREGRGSHDGEHEPKGIMRMPYGNERHAPLACPRPVPAAACATRSLARVAACAASAAALLASAAAVAASGRVTPASCARPRSLRQARRTRHPCPALALRSPRIAAQLD